MRIGIIGNGIVGNATARCYMEHHEVRVWDAVREKRTTNNFRDILDCGIIFVCLPTDAVEYFFRSHYTLHTECNYVLKSTVSIGTTRRLREEYGLVNLVHSPEFLTERCAVTDAQLPARNIVGAVQLGTTWRERSVCSVVLEELYKNRFPGVPVHVVTSDESEAIKLFTNAFFATKVTFFNEMFELAAALHLDWNSVLGGILSDGRISHSHTQVPGPDGKMGFGGKCLPKDLAMLVKQLPDDSLLRAVMRVNDCRRGDV